MTSFQIHPGAQKEFEEAFLYYLEIDPELADDFDSIFFRYLGTILASPLLFNIRRGSVRRVNLKPRFAEYYIAYMIWNQQVVILAIAHAKRRPYYWGTRISEAKKMF
jgi:plasmid stabilization system protein ParE